MNLFDIDPPHSVDVYRDRDLDRLSDATLAESVSRVLARPRTADTSFTLHAPLELLARIRLLDRVGADQRHTARLRLVALAAIYDSSGEPIDHPPGPSPDSFEAAMAMLGSAIETGDVDQADRAVDGLDDPLRLATGSDALVPLLGAAGHLPILLSNWPVVQPTTPLDHHMIRHMVRDLAGSSQLRFRFDHPNRDRAVGSRAELESALAAVSPVGDPGFGVFLLIDQAEQHQALARFPSVDAAAVPGAFRLIMRRAATAMLTDDPHAAPYGWSHALTMPLALGQLAPSLADPTLALDAALTEWCGFRMAHGAGPSTDYDPPAANARWPEAIDDGADQAGAAAWHHPAVAEVESALIDNAACSHDAHLVKYTVACLDAAALDPDHQRLYLAGAAFLAGWWRQAPAADDPLIDSIRVS
ncbi:MAG: hypothetical protein ACR2QE_12880 [Acidimicrobiales bacterium]